MYLSYMIFLLLKHNNHVDEIKKLEVNMKKTGEIQKHTKGYTSAKYDSRSAESKQEQKKDKDGIVNDKS